MSKTSVASVLYEAHDFPIFQNRMYDTSADARPCSRWELRLVQDRETGLVFNQAFRPELMAYDLNYQNEQAVSPVFREHLLAVAEIVARTMGRQSIVEVGCGKGFFLEMLLSMGFDVVGFDPTYESRNPRIVRQYFDPTADIRASGLVLRHVLEHIQDPFRFLELLRDANGGAGKIFIKVPCFDWISRHRAWYTRWPILRRAYWLVTSRRRTVLPRPYGAGRPSAGRSI